MLSQVQSFATPWILQAECWMDGHALLHFYPSFSSVFFFHKEISLLTTFRERQSDTCRDYGGEIFQEKF